MGHGSGTPSYNDVIERLVPRDERGAYLPDNSDWRIGNCINFRRDEYEKVRITINEDACSPHYMAVTWKELECPLEDPSPVDLCGRAAERSRNALDSFSRRIEFLIARLEKDAAQEDDQAAKQYLLNYAASLRSDLADLPKPSSDLRVPNPTAAQSIAETELVARFGRSRVNGVRLSAALNEGVWSVSGTLRCPSEKGPRTDEPKNCRGITVVRIQAKDGAILSITETK